MTTGQDKPESNIQALKRLQDKLVAMGVRNIGFTWAPGAENATTEERAADVLKMFEAIERGEFEEVQIDDAPSSLARGEYLQMLVDFHRLPSGGFDAKYPAYKDLDSHGLIYLAEEALAPSVAGMPDAEAMRSALQWIAAQENLTFAECSLAEEIVGRAKAALASPAATETTHSLSRFFKCHAPEQCGKFSPDGYECFTCGAKGPSISQIECRYTPSAITHNENAAPQEKKSDGPEQPQGRNPVTQQARPLSDGEAPAVAAADGNDQRATIAPTIAHNETHGDGPLQRTPEHVTGNEALAKSIDTYGLAHLGAAEEEQIIAALRSARPNIREALKIAKQALQDIREFTIGAQAALGYLTEQQSYVRRINGCEHLAKQAQSRIHEMLGREGTELASSAIANNQFAAPRDKGEGTYGTAAAGKPTDTPPAVAAVIAKIDKAKWTLRIPADVDRDSDLILCEALESARQVLDTGSP